jgi:hypothetical protein
MSRNASAHLLRPALAVLLITALGACATINGEATQTLQVQTVDSADRPIEGMRCHASNAYADYFGDSPMLNLTVRRSSSDLKIECRRGDQVAHATAVSRGRALDAAAVLLPGGTAYLVIDHITGYKYAYPSWLRLRVGQNLVFDANDELAGHPTPGLQAEMR